MGAAERLPNFTTQGRVLWGFFFGVRKVRLGPMGNLSGIAFTEAAHGVGFRTPNAVFASTRHERRGRVAVFYVSGHFSVPSSARRGAIARRCSVQRRDLESAARKRPARRKAARGARAQARPTVPRAGHARSLPQICRTFSSLLGFVAASSRVTNVPSKRNAIARGPISIARTTVDGQAARFALSVGLSRCGSPSRHKFASDRA